LLLVIVDPESTYSATYQCCFQQIWVQVSLAAI